MSDRKRTKRNDWYSEFCRLEWDEPGLASLIIMCGFIGLTLIVSGLTLAVIQVAMEH